MAWRARPLWELLESEQACDISISGLGWISVGALASLRRTDAPMVAVLEVWVPKGVQVSTRPPMPIARLPAAVPAYEFDEDEPPPVYRQPSDFYERERF